MTIVKVTVDNGSANVRLGREESNPDRPCSCFLTLLLLSITLNLAIVVAILRSSCRSFIFNILLLSLTLSLLLDAGLNLVMASIIRASWPDLHHQLGSDYLNLFCHLNAASMQLSCILQIFFLALISAHRSMSLQIDGSQSDEFDGKHCEFKHLRRLNHASWLVAPIMVLPLTLQAVDCRYFHERYSCSPAYVTQRAVSTILASLVILLGYCLPWSAVLYYWITLLLRVSKERQRLQTLELVALQRAAAQSSPIRGLGSPLGFSIPSWSQVWGNSDTIAGDGFQFFVLSGLLTIFHTTLVVPHIIYLITTEFYTSHDVPKYQKLFDLTYELPKELQAIYTSSLDNTFTWLRFLYTVIAPVTILIIHKELRKQFYALYRHCKNMNHVHASSSSYIPSSFLFGRKRKRHSKLKTLTNVKTPILFASKDGIFLRTAAVPYGGLNSFRLHIPSESAMIEPRFVSAFTDVSVKQPPAGRSVIRLGRSPEASTTARSLRNEVENLEDDEVASRPQKGGKSVRFSRRVSEIPLNDSGVSSSGSGESTVIINVKPTIEHRPTDQISETKAADCRASDPFATFSKLPKVAVGVGGSSKPIIGRTLENILSSSLASSSSNSYLLSLSQRMRNKKS